MPIDTEDDLSAAGAKWHFLSFRTGLADVCETLQPNKLMRDLKYVFNRADVDIWLSALFTGSNALRYRVSVRVLARLLGCWPVWLIVRVSDKRCMAGLSDVT